MPEPDVPTPPDPLTDPASADVLFQSLYRQLHALASRSLNAEAPGHLFQTTDIIHEAYVRMSGAEPGRWPDDQRFVAEAARVIRHLLVDHARARRALKRGGGWIRVDLSAATISSAPSPGDADLVDLDAALKDLAAVHPMHARLVELRFFGGMTADQAAAALGITARRADDAWALAKAWLRRALADREPSA